MNCGPRHHGELDYPSTGVPPMGVRADRQFESRLRVRGHRRGLIKDVYRLAEERGYVVDEVTVALGEGRTRPGWMVFDLADQTFVHPAVNWKTAEEVEAYLNDSSG